MTASKTGGAKAARFVCSVVPGIDAAKPLSLAKHRAAATVALNIHQGSARAAAQAIKPDPRWRRATWGRVRWHQGGGGGGGHKGMEEHESRPG